MDVINSSITNNSQEHHMKIVAYWYIAIVKNLQVPDFQKIASSRYTRTSS